MLESGAWQRGPRTGLLYLERADLFIESRGMWVPLTVRAQRTCIHTDRPIVPAPGDPMGHRPTATPPTCPPLPAPGSTPAPRAPAMGPGGVQGGQNKLSLKLQFQFKTANFSLEFDATLPRIREKTSMNGNRPNHRPRAAPGPPQHPTPPGMTPGDSQDRPRATGARGLATHHRYVAVAGSLQPADLRPWRPNLASCGRLGGRAGP